MIIDMGGSSSEFGKNIVYESLDPRLLEVLVCPISKASLVHNIAANELYSAGAHLAYPVRNGIPIMLVEEAGKIVY